MLSATLHDFRFYRISVNLKTPHPQPLSHAWERGARESGSHSPVQKKLSILWLPPFEGGRELGLGDEGKRLEK
ncbi:hypothetical protein MC7420_6562 [Coleofasciculus chthonoplastes PCC 7420]|uniref:Uncharacterized protein n=1 Tax=Coleofasciculus chthonoplastes PCC 7420 TaxID=118168 RepID=B4W587_9CYAN|nr:hypothetical protein MC7420_6562 [Coleofasciculus chthonoplastes PCC 7420]